MCSGSRCHSGHRSLTSWTSYIHKDPPQKTPPPPFTHPCVQGCYVVRQGTPMEAHVAPYFVEDALPSSASPGFFEFMQVLQKDILGK